MDSGLYQVLVDRGLLIRHEELTPVDDTSTGTTIAPVPVPQVSYPYEWSFSEYQDAALLTLEVCRIAIAHDMILKDASAYNVQFLEGRPVFIDTGSFEALEEGIPWSGYRQFCQHFLAPLTLAARIDIRLLRLLETHIDGVPLDLASKLLNGRTGLSPGAWMHIRLHARAQRKFSDQTAASPARTQRQVSRNGLLGLLDSLRGNVTKLRGTTARTEWGDYYDETNYGEEATRHKREMVSAWCQRLSPSLTWDLGGNTGFYSRAAVSGGGTVVCWDVDPLAVERNYLQVRDGNETRLLPLLLDLTNPSKGIGWGNRERDSLAARGPVDLVMALALVHHLAIANNVPLDLIAEYFASLGKHLIIEFVPREDSQVQRLLLSREDIFADYDIDSFAQAFSRYFIERERVPVSQSVRTLFLFELAPGGGYGGSAINTAASP